MSARGLMAAADQIEARIVEAEKLRAALEEIKRLHEPRRWGSTDQILICPLCCLDAAGYREQFCVDYHEHTADGPGCATAETIARAGL